MNSDRPSRAKAPAIERDDPQRTRVDFPALRPEWQTLLSLQRSAGNRAVGDLVTLQRNDKFDTAAKAGDQVGAPEELELPPELKDGMTSAWAASFPDGKSQEQGGILVRTKDGKYVWRAGKAGSSGAFSLNMDDVKEGETIVATGHTHPYDKTEGSHKGVAFSGGDLANMIEQDVPIKVVQAGDKTFVAAKTKEFNALVAAAKTAADKDKLYKEMTAAWDTAFAAAQTAGDGFVAAVEAAARAVCTKYHLVFYEGGEGKVKQPAAKVHVEVTGAAKK